MLLPTLPDPVPGLAEGFADSVTGNFEQFRQNDQTILDGVDGTFDYFFGRGVIEDSYTSPVVVAGTGLSANVGPLVALIGRTHVPASGSVILPASTTSTIWLLQVGAQLVATDGTDPGTDENWSIVLGTATTDATHVTSRADTFAVVSRPGSSTAGGTVNSVGLALPGSEFTVSGSPVTVAGTLSGSWKTQAPGKVLAGPAAGSAAVPAFRALQTADLPPPSPNVIYVENLPTVAGNGTTDDTAALQAAIGTLAAAGGGQLVFGPNDYRVATSLSGADGIQLSGAGMGATRLLFDDVAGTGIDWAGRNGTPVACASDLAAGTQTVTVAAGTGVGFPAGSFVRFGELSPPVTGTKGVWITRVASRAGDVLTLEGFCPYGYLQSSVLQATPFPTGFYCGVAIEDMTLCVATAGVPGMGTNRGQLVYLRHAYGARITRVEVDGGANNANMITLSNCLASRVEACAFRRAGPLSASAALLACTSCSIERCHSESGSFTLVLSASCFSTANQNRMLGRSTSGRGIKFEEGTAHSQANDNLIDGAAYIGIYFQDVFYCQANDNVIAHTGTAPTDSAIAIGGQHPDVSHHNQAVGNLIHDVTGFGINLGSGTPTNPAFAAGHCVEDNLILRPSSWGIVGGVSGCSFQSNTIDGWGGDRALGLLAGVGGCAIHDTIGRNGSGSFLVTGAGTGDNDLAGNYGGALPSVEHATDHGLDLRTSTSPVTLIVAASDTRDPKRGDAGYRCDGTADDVEINAAIAAIAAKGGQVKLLEGTYNCAARVSILASNTALVGSGPATLLKRGFDEGGGVFGGVVTVGATDGSSTLSGITVSDLSIDGQKAAFTVVQDCGVVLRGAISESEVARVNISNAAGYGFYNNGAGARNRYTDVRSTGCANYGLYATGMSDLRLSGVRSTADLGGLRLATLDRIGVERCSVSGATSGHGIWCAGVTRSTLLGCILEGGANYGIVMDGSSRYTITACEMTAHTLAGIWLTATSPDGTVMGCVSTNGAHSGIYVAVASGVVLSGNRFTGNARYGIEINALSSFITLGPNDLRGNTLGAISDGPATAAAGSTRHTAQGGAVRALTAAYTLDGSESLVICDATSAAFAVTLPAASGALRGLRTTIKKTDSSANAVTITGTVDGAANPTLTAQNQALTLVCDGAAWRREVPPTAQFGAVAANLVLAGPASGGASAPAFRALVAADVPAGAGAIPIGGIVLWSGSVASIPANWHLCDGTTGTPDLRDKFVVGAGSTYAVAATGGSASAHNHTLSGTAVVGAATVTQSVDNSGALPRFDTAAAAHIHNLSGAVDGTTVLPPYFSLAYIMRTS